MGTNSVPIFCSEVPNRRNIFGNVFVGPRVTATGIRFSYDEATSTNLCILNGVAVTNSDSARHPEFMEDLRKFYKSTQFQHKVSFWASIVAAAVGFLVIL